MNTYLSLLRGVNVSGKNKIIMSELKTVFESSGFTRVKTFIQSGNVVFNTSLNDNDPIASLIEAAILKTLSLNIHTFLRSHDEMKKIVTGNPFLNEQGIDCSKLHVTFLKNEPEAGHYSGENERGDRFSTIGKEVYLYCPSGYGKTGFPNLYFEKRFDHLATTRNWRTVLKLLDLMKGLQNNIASHSGL